MRGAPGASCREARLTLQSCRERCFASPSRCPSLHGALRDQQRIEPPQPPAPVIQMSLSTSWWLLCLQGGRLLSRMGQEQESYTPAQPMCGLKALKGGGDWLLCGGRSWILRRTHSCCLLERPKRETNRKKSNRKHFQGIQLVADALLAGQHPSAEREHNSGAT